MTADHTQHTKPMTEVEVTCKLCIRGDDGVMEVFVQVPRDVLNLIFGQGGIRAVETTPLQSAIVTIDEATLWRMPTLVVRPAE